MSKERFMAAHEAAIDEYCEAHPEADWAEAYEKTGERAMEIMTDNLANQIDYYRMMAKERT